MRYNSFIFDLDGTLLDSMDLWYKVDRDFLAKRGFELDEEYTDFVKSTSIEDGALYTKTRFDLPESCDEIISEWNDAVFHGYACEVELKSGAARFLKEIKERGGKIACATALMKKNALAALQRCGVAELFDVFVTLEDMEKGVDKTTPDIFEEAAARLGTAPADTVVFEDVKAAVEGASKGGFVTCAFYDDVGSGGAGGWEEMKACADFSAKTWDDAFLLFVC